MSASSLAALPFRLPPPPGGQGCDLLLVAGEHSGDQHAAKAVLALRRRWPQVRVCALGGPALAAAGVPVLHDLTATSVVGVVEVLRHYSFFRALFAATLEWIGEYRPRAVCFVDYPGFNLRMARALRRAGVSRRGGGEVRTLFYISPQIWAWKAGRRFAMAETLDALAVIFPFEVACYADTTLPVEFVGHPFLAEDDESPVHYAEDGPVLLLPGSRRQAVGRIFPVLLRGYAHYRAGGGDRAAVVVSPGEEIDAVLRPVLDAAPAAVRGAVTVRRPGERTAAAAVLTSSGTMSLRCTLAGIPGAIAYRANPITYLLGCWLVRVPYLGIANLLLGEAMYPEFIQGEATPGALAEQIALCVSSAERRAATQQRAARLREILAHPAERDVGLWLARNLTQ
jgi:lipid-A-disaccharide synthase